MTDPAGMAHSGFAAGKETFSVALSTLAKIIVPLVSALAGVFIGPRVIGGGNSLFKAISSAGSNAISGPNAATLSRLIAAGISAIIGGAFWSLRGHGGTILMLVGGAFGGFFFGTSLGYVFSAMNPTSFPDGLIDKLVGSVGQAAAGG